jgi:hypothetical protein
LFRWIKRVTLWFGIGTSNQRNTPIQQGRNPPRLNCPRKLGWDPILGDCSKIVFENRERSFEYPEHVFHLPAVATARSYFSNQLALFCDDIPCFGDALEGGFSI